MPSRDRKEDEDGFEIREKVEFEIAEGEEKVKPKRKEREVRKEGEREREICHSLYYNFDYILIIINIIKIFINYFYYL